MDSTSNNLYTSKLNSNHLHDLNSPYDFKTWSKVFRKITSHSDLDDYNQYLIDWFDKKRSIKTDRLFEQKKRFLRFLKEIQAFFSRTEALSWYNTIDIDNDRHIAVAVPYFAKKLRQVSDYYKDKRL